MQRLTLTLTLTRSRTCATSHPNPNPDQVADVCTVFSWSIDDQTCGPDLRSPGYTIDRFPYRLNGTCVSNLAGPLALTPAIALALALTLALTPTLTLTPTPTRHVRLAPRRATPRHARS